MLKSFIIKLRHKPKAVRDRIALSFAVGFTVVVLAVWIFSVPGQFSRLTNDNAPGLFDELKEDIAEGAPDFEAITSELKELATSTPETESTSIIPNEFPTSTNASNDATTSTRSIRLATTSQESASSTENS